MELEPARLLAQALVERFRPHCERIEIAGSIRREKPEVKDIEIVAIPILVPPAPKFGDRKTFKTPLDRTLYFIAQLGLIQPERVKGDKYKQFWLMKQLVHVIKVDLFLVTPPAQWGVIDVIRTGPAEFSQWMVTNKGTGGALPNNAAVRDGRVLVNPWNTATDVNSPPMPEEQDFFEFCGLSWIEPKDRRRP